MASSSNVHGDAMQAFESTGSSYGTAARHVTWPGLPADDYVHEQAQRHEQSTDEQGYSDSLLFAPIQGEVVVKQELTSSPASRPRRLQTVPSSHNHSRQPHPAAISVPHNYNPHTAGQDVRSIVNSSAPQHSSTVPRPGPSSSPFETPVSNFHNPFSHYVITRPNPRPRTSNQVFESTQDLANHYGLPQILPPPPRTTPHRNPPPQDLSSLSANYLTMLSQKPANTTMPASQTAPVNTVSPADLSAPVLSPQDVGLEQADLDNLVQLMTSPEFQDLNTFEFLTSPREADFSPDDTPFDGFLNTPLMGDFGDEPLLSPGPWNDMPLFPDLPAYQPPAEKQHASAVESANAVFDGLLTLSPTSPNLDSFNNANTSFTPTTTSLNPQSLYAEPRRPSEAPQSAPTSTHTSSTPSSSRRKSTATGTRRGLTTEALVPIDAPTQPRKYATPSQTSRKEVPAVFARKRARSTAFPEDEEDELTLEPLPPNSTEKQQIEWKRRQNTIAARKSRARKLQHTQELESEVERYKHEARVWETRARVVQELLVARGAQPIYWDPSELEGRD